MSQRRPHINTALGALANKNRQIQIQGKVKNPTRNYDVWGTQEKLPNALLPGCPFALFGGVLCLWADGFGGVKLEQLNRCSVVQYERNANSN